MFPMGLLPCCNTSGSEMKKRCRLLRGRTDFGSDWADGRSGRLFLALCLALFSSRTLRSSCSLLLATQLVLQPTPSTRSPASPPRRRPRPRPPRRSSPAASPWLLLAPRMPNRVKPTLQSVLCVRFRDSPRCRNPSRSSWRFPTDRVARSPAPSPIRAHAATSPRSDAPGDRRQVPHVHQALPHRPGTVRAERPARELAKLGGRSQGLCQQSARPQTPGPTPEARRIRRPRELALRVVERDRLLWLARSRRARSVLSLFRSVLLPPSPHPRRESQLTPPSRAPQASTTSTATKMTGLVGLALLALLAFSAHFSTSAAWS